jgi:release factor glutamine methyltransferase
MAHILGKPRTWLLTHPEENLSSQALSSFQKDINLLADGIPLPYVLGQWEFYGLEFTITPDTLIPRPETEVLVEQAITWLSNKPDRRLIADLGTGSGCIAVALAKHVRSLSIIATEISFQALSVARSNTIQHKVSDRIHCLQADLFPPVECQFDLICANLPYIPTGTLRTLKIFGKEPSLALDGGVEQSSTANRSRWVNPFRNRSLTRKTSRNPCPSGLSEGRSQNAARFSRAQPLGCNPDLKCLPTKMAIMPGIQIRE